MSALVPQTPSSSEANSTPRSSVVTDNDADNDSDSVFSGTNVRSADNELQNYTDKGKTDKNIVDVDFKGSGLVCSDSSSSELGDRKTTRVVNVDGKRRTVFHRAPLQSEV